MSTMQRWKMEYNNPLRSLFFHIFSFALSLYEWRHFTSNFFFLLLHVSCIPWWRWWHARWLHGLSTKTYIYLYRTARWWQWLHVACLDPLTNKFYFKSIEWIRLEVIVSAHLHFHHRFACREWMPRWKRNNLSSNEGKRRQGNWEKGKVKMNERTNGKIYKSKNKRIQQIQIRHMNKVPLWEQSTWSEWE